MQVVYYRLFQKMKNERITRKQMMEELGFSNSIFDKLNKNGNVTTETIGKICNFFRCQPNDIMEVIFDDGEDIEFLKQRQIAELQRQIEQLQGK